MRLHDHAARPFRSRALAVTAVAAALGLGLVTRELGQRDVATPAVSSAAPIPLADAPADSAPERARVRPSPSRAPITASAEPEQRDQADEEEESGAGYATRLRKEITKLDAMTNFLLEAEDPTQLCDGCELLFLKGSRSVLSWKITHYLERLDPLHREMREALARGDEAAAENAYHAQYGAVRKDFLEVLASRELFWLGLNGYLDRRTPQTELNPDIFVRRPGRELKREDS